MEVPPLELRKRFVNKSEEHHLHYSFGKDHKPFESLLTSLVSITRLAPAMNIFSELADISRHVLRRAGQRGGGRVKPSSALLRSLSLCTSVILATEDPLMPTYHTQPDLARPLHRARAAPDRQRPHLRGERPRGPAGP